MSVHMDQNSEINEVAPSTTTPTWTINVSDVRTVKVTNISLAASKKDIMEFFSYSGDIQYVEMQRESEASQVAYITFKEMQGADGALCLAGSMIDDLSVSITPVENYQLPPDAPPLNPEVQPTAIKKAEDVVSTVLAKGFVLSKEIINKAKSLDERHHLTSNASSTITSINDKLGLSEKLTIGTTLVSEKVKNVDEKFQVSEKTKIAFSVAEQKAGKVMSNELLSWFGSAYDVVAKAAENFSSMTKEKVEEVEGKKKAEIISYHEGVSSVVNEEFDDHGKVDEKRLEII